MDVLRLDKDTYIPDELVEGFTTMIWTERYNREGEFKMVIPRIEYARALIPEGSLITLMDSKQVMWVETHTIQKNEEGIPQLEIVGRTYETFLENRELSNSMMGSDINFLLSPMSSATAAMYYAWTDIVANVNGTSSPDNVPNLIVTDSTTAQDAAIQREAVTWGEKYKTVMDLVKTGGLGLRTIRPKSASANAISFAQATMAPILTPRTDISEIRLDFYNGLDRTRQQSVNTPVVMRYDMGDISNPEYLFSKKGLKNVAIVKTNNGNRTFYAFGADASTSGLDRSVLPVDASDIEYTAGTTDQASFEDAVQTRAMTELAKYNQKTLFSGEVSPVANYHYDVDYSLGDKITLFAEYGFEQTMLVSEYVRTYDKDGDRGYPTLEQPT